MLEQVSVPGADLWTITTGCGPPLVLAHGGPGMWDYMGPVAEMVDDLVTVHRYDQRGSGRSPAHPPYHLADFITDLETLREHWRHERWVVGGHSWGAQLALLYAGRYPHRVAGLILISTSGLTQIDAGSRRLAAERRLGATGASRLTELSERLAADPGDAAADRELTRLVWSTEFSRPEAGMAFADELLESDFQIDTEVSRSLVAQRGQWLREAVIQGTVARLAAPALVVQGTADLRPSEHAEELARSLPRGELLLVPEAGHFPWLERPDAVRSALRRFLAGL
ncbi:MAG TPA: alpha/beta hydrolase [Candidatus Dormibacteraeota bacterium]|nr:alpha/beta hydrolase [Candidatus Dormibacteraeota bacterium]